MNSRVVDLYQQSNHFYACCELIAKEKDELWRKCEELWNL